MQSPDGPEPALAPDLRALVEQCVARYPTDGARAVDEISTQFPHLADALRRRVAILERAGLLNAETTDRRYPEQLGDFRLLELIGEGGMGAVFKAQQQSLGRLVALKVIRAEHAYSPRSRERFRREIEAIAAMRSPGIVQVYTVGDDGGVPFYAMELIDGINLADLLLELRRAPPERSTGGDIRAALARVVQRHDSTSAATEADELFAGTYVQACCRLAMRVARTLAHAHERGVLHRDVKPSNVMLDRQGRVLLLDFGLARAVATQDEAMTRTGAVVGSLAYMAPEQMLGAKELDARVDVYGLGVTLYELLTHSAAFRGDTQDDLRDKVLGGAAPPPTQLNPAIPRDAETICLRAMAPERQRRYPSAQALADDLQRFLELRPIEARRSGAAYRVRRWAQRHPAKATALAAGLLIVVGTPSMIAVRERTARAEIAGALAEAERYQKSYEHALTAAMHGMERTTMRLAGDEQLASGKLDGLRRELLEGAAQFWQTMAEVGDPHPKVRDALFRARGVLASVRTELGDVAGARAVLDCAIADLERLRATVAEDQRASIDQHLAKLLFDQADALKAQRQPKLAIAAWERSAELALACAGTAPNPAAARRHVQRCRLNIAQAQAQGGEGAAAAELCRQVIAELGQDGDPQLLLRARTLFGAVLLHAGEWDAAVPELLAVIALLTERQQREPTDATNLRELKSALHNLGHLYQQRDDMPSARQYIERAADCARRLAAAFPDRVDNQLTLVSSLMVLGNVCLRQEDKVAAEATCREAVALAQSVADAHPDMPDAVSALAEVRSTLGQVLMEDPAHGDEAVTLLRAAADAHAVLAHAPDATVQALAHLGTTHGLLASALGRAGDREGSVAAEEAALSALADAGQRDAGSPIIRGNTARVLASSISRGLRAGDEARVRALLERAVTMGDVDRELWTLLQALPKDSLVTVQKLRPAPSVGDKQ